MSAWRLHGTIFRDRSSGDFIAAIITAINADRRRSSMARNNIAEAGFRPLNCFIQAAHHENFCLWNFNRRHLYCRAASFHRHTCAAWKCVQAGERAASSSGQGALGNDGAASVKGKLMGKLTGESPSSDNGYKEGAKGILNNSDGKQLDLSGGGMKAEAARQICDKVLAQGKFM